MAAARVLREGLLEAAELGRASAHAAELTNRINDYLNERSDPAHPERLTVAESLVTRALVARGVLQVAGDWWAELGQAHGGAAPTPEYHAALRSIVEDLPPELRDGMIDTRTGEER